jgi:Spy/CpxP family protein refolding chaperone
MNRSARLRASGLALLLPLGVLALGLAWPPGGAAQDAGKHRHAGKPAGPDKDLAAQVHDLQAKIAKLEAALKQGHKGMPSEVPSTGRMGGTMSGRGAMGKGGMEGMNTGEMMQMMGGMMEMMGGTMKDMGGMRGKGMAGMGGMTDMDGMMTGGMRGQKQGMPGMGGRGMRGVGMMDNEGMDMLGMLGMGSMGGKGMGKMRTASALPGFPGASHIYHVGATGFFLDHPEHIQLTTKQQATLNVLKEKALLENSTSQRKIDEAEQELWTLTGSDQPDAAKIDAQVRAIERLRGDQRLAFIRAVGEAARVLTDEQRQARLGTAADKAEKAPAHAGH